MQKLVAICFAAASFTGGCGFADPAAVADAPPAVSEKPAAAIPQTRASDMALGNLALKIASEHLSADPGDLEIVRIEAVQWPDSSIGCPGPGFEYLQVVTPGHLAQVRDQRGVVHRVHMADGRGLVCEKRADKFTEQATRSPTFTRRQLEALARADLATRLGVGTAEVSVLRSRAVDWPDATLGCPSAEAPPASGPSKGFVITLVSHGRQYTYHSDWRQVMPCPPIERR